MAYIEVSREGWTTGKRKKTYFAWWKQFDISDDLWEQLNKFAEEDQFSSVPHYEWQQGEITLHRSQALDDVFKTYSKAPKDWEVFHDIVEKEGMYIKMKPLQFKYEYKVMVKEVDAKNQRAFIKQFPTQKQFEEAVDFTTPEYWVDVSDRCIYEGIKPHDKVMIRKFIDDRYLAVYVCDRMEDEEDDEFDDDDDIFGNYTESEREKEERIKRQRKSAMDLMGDY